MQGSRTGSAVPSMSGSRKNSFVESELDNEPLTGVSGKWSNSSVGSNDNHTKQGQGQAGDLGGIDSGLEAFSNAAMDAMKEAGFDLRSPKEPLSPLEPTSPTTPLPMLSRRMSSRRRSSRSSKAMV